MPTNPGTIPLRFHVLLVPIGPDGAEQHDHPVDGGIVEVELHLGTTPPKPPYTGIRDGGFARGGVISNRDTQANETHVHIGQATDPEFVPGYGTPADVGLAYVEGTDGPISGADAARLFQIERELDTTPTMPQEQHDRLSAEAWRIRHPRARGVTTPRPIREPGGET